MDSLTASAKNYYQTEPRLKDVGSKAKPEATAPKFYLTALCSRGNGKTVNSYLASANSQMAKSTTANGTRVNQKVTALKFGQTGVNTKVIGTKANRSAKV